MANELQSLSELFQNRLFRIPDYQRGYAWQLPQLVDFWDDLYNLQTDRYHYTGLLSLKPLNASEIESLGNDCWIVGDYTPYHIVDGQQRLTTFIILINEIVSFICSLEENRNKKEDEIIIGGDKVEKIRQKYICQKRPPYNLITTYMFGYETDNPSDRYLRYRVLNEPDSGEVDETYYTKNLLSAKNFFSDNLKELYIREGNEGINKLYQKLTQKLMFNLHEFADDYDVFVAFETMNNRGKRLTNLELLKNRLIYLTTLFDNKKFDRAEKSNLRDKINEAWKEVYQQLGKNENTALSDDDYLRAHWIIYFSYTRNSGDDYISFLLNKFSAKNVYEKAPVIKENQQVSIIEENNDVDIENEEPLVENTDEIEHIYELEPKTIAEYVDSLKDYAKYWYDTFFPYDSSTLTDDEKLWIDRLNHIGISYFRPLITVALKKSSSKEERIKLFTAIERFIFVCFRVANLRSITQSTVYYGAARDLNKGETTIDAIVDKLNEYVEDNIQYAISTFTNNIEKQLTLGKKDGYYAWNTLHYFLFEYEYSLWESTGVKKLTWELFTKSEKDKVTIEHILPQTPTKWYWKNQFRQYINNDDEMNRLTGSLGNLLPLAQSINSSLQNDPFNEKKNPKNTDRRGYSSGSNSEIEVAKEDDWDGQRIYKRSLSLLSFMEKRWSISMTAEQKEKLTFVGFVNDNREIPNELPETEDYDSTQTATERRRAARYNYWSYALPVIRNVHGGPGHPYGHVSPTESNNKDGFFGIRCIHLYCSVGLKQPRQCVAGLWIDAGDRESNKRVFDMLESHRDVIEQKMTMPIEWNRKDDCRASSIDVILHDADFTDPHQWEQISSFHAKMTKELSDNIVYAYENELREMDYIRTVGGNKHLTDVIKMWANAKDAEEEIILNRDKCTKKYTRFTTSAMTEIYPFGSEANSGWKTNNFYFYEIEIVKGNNVHMQFALSGQNMPNNLKELSNRIIEHFNVRCKTENWEWKCPFATPSVEIPAEITDEEIHAILDEQYEQLMAFESGLVSFLEGNDNGTA